MMNENHTIEEQKGQKRSLLQLLKEMLQHMRANLVPTAVFSVFWLVLGWLKASGIQWAILRPLNFLTGALNGLEGSALGGTIGKALLLITFNSVYKGILTQRGNFKAKMSSFLKQFKDEGKLAILKKIPQYSNLKVLLKQNTPKMLGCGAISVGCALLFYPWITSDGSLVNSMVCITLFFSLGNQLVKQRGLVISLLNMVLQRKSKGTIDRAVVDTIVAGLMFGMAVSVGSAVIKEIPEIGERLWFLLIRMMPWVLIVGGFWEIFGKNEQKSTDHQSEGGNAS